MFQISSSSIEWTSVAIGIIGIAFAFYFYRLSSIGPRLVSQRQAFRLIGEDDALFPPQVEIRFKSRSVDRLTKTYIVLWNSGQAMIRGSDIVADDPPRCAFTETCEILEANIIKTTRGINKCTMQLDATTASVAFFGFDYLDPGDGALVELLHTDTNRFPRIEGSIRGMPRGIENRGLTWLISPPGLRNNRVQEGAVALLMMLTGLTALTFALIPLHGVDRSDAGIYLGARIFAGVIGLAYVASASLVMIIRNRRFPKALEIPELYTKPPLSKVRRRQR